MRWPLSLLLLLTACNSILGVHAFTPAIESDAAVAVDGPPIDAPSCIGTPIGLGPFCLTDPPADVTLVSQTIPTDLCPGGHVIAPGSLHPICMIAGVTIIVSGTVRAIGPYPLVLVATDAIEASCRAAAVAAVTAAA